ncbi:MAG TPA: ThiF family adenylyltransferase [Bradyrhizobium sp.]|nr:ThiF family adenylyltransferase [Bradyrhizobium sp.]
MTRFDRNVRLFGKEGQRKLREAKVAVVGVGGLGSHVVQQLALLGVGGLYLVDGEQISTSNKNRYVGVRDDDPVPGTDKVDAALRLALSIDPSIKVVAIPNSLISAGAFSAVRNADYVFGCLDSDGPRFVLNDVSTAYAKPYLDLASDVVEGSFGGRVVFKTEAPGCLFCFGELDQAEVQTFLESPADRLNRRAAYGIERAHLNRAGPSVVSINGVIASLAVTEFMIACTELGAPKQFINYQGERARCAERIFSARLGCPYCGQWNSGDRADTARYLRATFAEA